jgi:hypothetical protein
VKLLEFENRREELENSINPFAWLILAHLDTMATTRNLERRVDCKFQLAMKLGRRGLRDEQARKLFNLIDWMMQLPPDLDKRWYNRVRETQEANKMPYINTIQRIEREEGLAQGEIKSALKYLSFDLEEQFGADGVAFVEELHSVKDSDRLFSIKKALRNVKSIEELRRFLSH